MQAILLAGHGLSRHPLDPLLDSLALFDSRDDLMDHIDALFAVRLHIHTHTRTHAHTNTRTDPAHR